MGAGYRLSRSWRPGVQTATTRHLTLAVNVSAHQFKEPDFVAQVLAALERQVRIRPGSSWS